MSKRKLALLILALILITTELQAVKVSKSQFEPGPPPNNLGTTSPTVQIQSPSQFEAYNSNDVWLNFTVTKPKIWLDDFSETYGAAVAFSYWGQFDYVQYSLDGVKSNSIPVDDVPLYTTYQSLPPASFNFSIKLNDLSVGQHILSVSVSGKVYKDYNWTSQKPNTLPIAGTSEINFSTSDLTPSPSPTPTPSVPEFSWLMILSLFLFLLAIATLVRSRRIFQRNNSPVTYYACFFKRKKPLKIFDWYK